MIEKKEKRAGVRINKYLADLGIASRREADMWIKQGRLTLNKKPVTLGSIILPEKDQLFLDRVLLTKNKPESLYLLLNKPEKFLCSRKQEEGKKTIYDLPKIKDLPTFVRSVGRLDYMTEGLLLLTNDGELNFRLSHPKYKVPRFYVAIASKALTNDELLTINKGFLLKGDPKLVQCKIKLLDKMRSKKNPFEEKKGFAYSITVFEGRNRLVRKIFEHFSCRVQRLIREKFGEIELPNSLLPGEYKKLSKNQVSYLKKITGLN